MCYMGVWKFRDLAVRAKAAEGSRSFWSRIAGFMILWRLRFRVVLGCWAWSAGRSLN